jgi:hypothetical protein
MQRVLDIDLDFFLHGVANDVDPESSERLGGREYPPWTKDETMSFLVDRCGLDAPLPEFAVENHREVFGKWRALIDAGRLQPPFQVTHVDAHGDLSMGEIGYKHILTELVHLPLEDRPAAAAARVGDGDYLAYAIGCRWLSDLDYVYNKGGGGDVHAYFWENFERASSAIRLAALTEDDIKALFDLQTPTVVYSEPRVPLHQIRRDAYTSAASFDLISLARSKPFTPPEADPLYEAIRQHFIDESALL